MENFSHKQMAVECFNKAWDLLDKSDRTSIEEEQMIHQCHTSFWHWTQVEDHTPQNISIGYWQLSRVYAVVGQGERALHYAELCVTVSKEAELPPFFIAYAYEAQARAQIELEQWEEGEKSIARAEEYMPLVTVDDSRKLVEADVLELRAMLDNR
ncbi:hypothetical protein [Paucisalibacillus globulus]|uniref:hypothetical protein n=1 Tax=Paucisalibacillus globulus TaxID=351095 RepID=UPI000BB79902|nr:hypothetical protein [Paucisalibacillus globulus]